MRCRRCFGAATGRVSPVARVHREKMEMLLDRVVAGEFAVSEMLPREVDLAAELAVSRGIAREVVRALEERGVASVRHGSGATLMPLAEWNLLGVLDHRPRPNVSLDGPRSAYVS